MKFWFTSIPDCGGAEYAKSNGIPVLIFPKPQRESSDGLSPTELVDVLRSLISLSCLIVSLSVFCRNSNKHSLFNEQGVWCGLCSASWLFETDTGGAGQSFS